MQPAAIKAVRMSPWVRLMQAIDAAISGSTALRIASVGTRLGGQELYDLCLAYSRSHKVQDAPANV